MKIAVLNIFLALALSALLMNGGASNSNSVGSLDEIIKCSEEVDRDCKFPTVYYVTTVTAAT